MLNIFSISLLIIYALRGLHTSSVISNHSNDLEASHYAKAEEILKYMNESVDPCENFFEFACGNWKTYHPADGEMWMTSAFNMHRYDFEDKLQLWLQTEDKMDSISERKVKDYFDSCIHFVKYRPDIKNSVKRLANEFGPMPALVGDKWQGDEFDWLQATAESRTRYGKIIILGTAITVSKDRSSYDIAIASGHLRGPTDLPDFKLKSIHYLHDYLDLEAAEAEQIANELVEFDQILWQANDNVIQYSLSDTVQELHDKYYPDLDINQLMNITYGYIPSERVINMTPGYLQALREIIKTTPKRVLANYISIRVIDKVLSDMENKNDWYACLAETQITFVDILSAMFYRTNNLKEKEQKVEQMWQVIRSNYQMILESSGLNWFDEKSREFALEKLHSVKFVVPSYQDKNFDVEYAHLHINVSNYLENLKSVLAYQTSKGIETFQYIDPEMEMSTPFYLPPTNTIYLTIPALMSDFMSSPMHPNACNYARLGALLSHEAAHGFNGDGRLFNKLGDETGQWQKDIEIEFTKRTKCLYDQYSNITFGGHKLLQMVDQTENLADNAGIVIAYHAYRRWYGDNARTKEEIARETLPNLNYTSQQLFFINFSQFNCAETAAEKLEWQATTDTHSPMQVRAYVPLMNFDEFSKEFKCPKGSPMNPIKKCRIY